MKNLIIGALSTIFLLLTILFMFTVYGRNVREQEIHDGLNNAMKIAVEMLMEDETNSPQSNEEFFSDFMQAFSMHINSASKITVDVMDIDYTIGLLRVRITSEYTHLTGTPGSVTVEKTIILEQYKNENAINTYTISYYSGGILYKEYDVEEQNKHIVPIAPLKDGTFAGWKDNKTGTIYSETELKNRLVTEDKSYVAVFN